MKFSPKNPPRRFDVGRYSQITISDCGSMHLEPDEQITFVTEDGAEYDAARKEWGFYATPSLNGRLSTFGLRGALMKNDSGRYFVVLVQSGKEQAFFDYLKEENLELACWMDSDEAFASLEERLAGK